MTDFITFRTTASSGRSRGPLSLLIRAAMLAAAFAILITAVIVGFFVVLPLMLIAGIASYIHLRRRVRRARQHRDAGVIDAEYTVIDRR